MQNWLEAKGNFSLLKPNNTIPSRLSKEFRRDVSEYDIVYSTRP